MTDEMEKEFWKLIHKVDILPSMMFGGFDTFEEYCKYGEMFLPIEGMEVPPEDMKYVVKPERYDK